MNRAAALLIVASTASGAFAQASGGVIAISPCAVNPGSPRCRLVVSMRAGNPGQIDPFLVAIFNAQIFLNDVVGGGRIERAQLLTGAETYGQGFAGAFAGPPNPSDLVLTGPVWPFRDSMVFDSFPPDFVPGGSDSGFASGVVAFDGQSIQGISRFQDTLSYGFRGNASSGIFNTLVGIDGGINFYVVDFVADDFTPRTVSVGVSADRVLSRDAVTGSEISLTFATSTSAAIVITPAPGTLILLAAAAFRRRRR